MSVTLTRKICLVLLAVLALASGNASAGGPRCFLHGIITPDSAMEKSSVSDMIRLHFDAKDKAKCELMMTAYCKYNVQEKEYSPTRLKGSFKPDVEKTEENIYKFTAKCKLISDEDD